ncbi:protein FAM81A-like [Montipora capricornis]|uniref:protein FAM81A-like n=1 Tax=Montipora foliosa TaxID=591990 RepID=UPI0035F1E224
MERPHSKEGTSLPALVNNNNSTDERLSRMENLEDRLALQEKTTRSLVDRALTVKEDIIESLSIAQISWQGEKKARTLLQEHIRTITTVVNRLSREIEALESEIRSRQIQVEGQGTAVKNLELHHVAGVTDLRGRMARCDSAIQRLVSDIRSNNEIMNDFRQKQSLAIKDIRDQINEQDKSISKLSLKIDRYVMEQENSLQKLKGDADQRVVQLDSKTKSVVEDIRGSISSNRLWAESEYFKIAQDVQTRLERFEGLMVERQEKLERRVDHYLAKVDKMLEEEKSKYYNVWEVRLKEVESEQDRFMHQAMGKMKDEYRQGFNSVHQSISSLQKVLHAKLKLLEDDLRKAINNVLRMVVLV